MSSTKSNLRLAAAFAALLTLALAVSCKGFFVNQPTSVTVTPNAPTLTSGQTISFAAQAAFSSSSKDVTKSATWSSSNPCVVLIVASGTDAGNATDVGTGGTPTISASYNGIVGTTTVSAPTGLTISPCPEKDVSGSPAVVFKAGTNQQFAASGTTLTVTWTATPSSTVSITSGGLATFGPGSGPATINASDGTTTGTLLIQVQ
jgi:hypothetical protein